MESGIEREILRIEREIEQLKLDVRTLTSFRQPSLEQQLANLWYNPVSGCSGTIVLTSSPTTWIVGSNTFTATLSGNCGVPTGTVGFYLDGVLQGSAVTISGGVASNTLSIATGGSHTVLAVYSGDFTYSGGQASITQNIAVGHTYCNCSNVPSLTLTDSKYGTFALTYDSTIFNGGGFSSGCKQISIPAKSPCSAITINILYAMDCFSAGRSELYLYYLLGSGPNFCPILGSCATLLSNAQSHTGNGMTWHWVGPESCGPPYSTAFSAKDPNTGSVDAGGIKLSYTISDTVTISG